MRDTPSMSDAIPDASEVRTRRGPYKNGLRRRQQILETAVQVFGQYGYAGASLHRIAELVGVSDPALIRHFGSKEGLFTAALEHSDKQNTVHEPDSTDGLAFFEHFARAVETNVRQRGLVELLLTVATEASDDGHPAHPFITKRYRDLVATMCAQLRRAGERGEVRRMDDAEIEAEVRTVIALMDGLELQWLLDPEVDLVATYGRQFAHIVERWTSGRDGDAATPNG